MLTPQFDLVNFWINAKPKEVFGMGSLAFYGSENGKKSGWARDYYRARDSKEAATDPFAIHLEDQPDLKMLYADAEHVGESAVTPFLVCLVPIRWNVEK